MDYNSVSGFVGKSLEMLVYNFLGLISCFIDALMICDHPYNISAFLQKDATKPITIRFIFRSFTNLFFVGISPMYN